MENGGLKKAINQAFWVLLSANNIARVAFSAKPSGTNCQ